MLFIILLFLTTLAVAGSAALFSVYGLGQVFAGSFIPVLIMGGSIEMGKLIAASFLYKFWDYPHAPRLLRVYMIGAVLTIMLVTSAGIFGFLTAAYQTDTISLRQQEETIVLYDKQKVSYHNRLDGINKQIEAVPEVYITKRMELIKTFEVEKNDILNKISELDIQLLDLKTTILTTEAKIGPIIYVAKALGRDSDEAVLWFVLIIIFVFDPLAVSLTLATNIAIRKYQEDKLDSDVVSDVVSDIVSDTVNEQPDPHAPPSDDMAKLTDMVGELSAAFHKDRVRTNLNSMLRK